MGTQAKECVNTYPALKMQWCQRVLEQSRQQTIQVSISAQCSLRIDIDDDLISIALVDVDGALIERNPFIVRVEWSACNYGGKRPWFLCPDCHHRVAILYYKQRHACRKCHKLVYPTQRMGKHDLDLHKVDKLRKRLGWPEGLFSLKSPFKPKGMHWVTYDQLLKEYDSLEQKIIQELANKLGYQSQK